MTGEAGALGGSLGDASLPALLGVAARARATARLDLERPGVRKSLWLAGGDLAYASSTDPDDRLGEWLLRAGRIGRVEFDRASALVTRERRLGQALVEIGILEPRELAEYVTRHLADIGVSLFSWRDGAYRFEVGASAPPTTLRVAVATPDVVLRGARSVREWSRLVQEVGPLATRYRLTTELDRLTTPMDLSQGEWAILSTLAEPRTVAEICAASKLGDFRVHQTLLAFRALAIADADAEADPARAALAAALASAGAGASRVAGPEESPDVDLALLPEAGAGERGTLAGAKLPDLLRSLYVGRRTGTLRLAREGTELRVDFNRGAIVAAGSNAPGRRMGPTVVRLGKGSAEQVERAARRAPGRRLGDELVREGILSRDDVKRAVETQIRDVLLPAFAWPDGAWSFDDGAAAPSDAIVSEVSTAQLILEGVREMADFHGVAQFLLTLDARFRVSSDPRLAFQRLELRPDEGYLLSRIDGTSTLRELVAISPLGEEETCRAVFGFLSCGMIEAESGGALPAASTPRVVPPSATGQSPRPGSLAVERVESLHASLGDLDHYALLGVPRGAAPIAIDAAWLDAATRYHPDGARAPREREMLEAVFARVAEAGRVLRDPAERRTYDDLLAGPPEPAPAALAAEAGAPQDPRREASEAFREARDHLSRRQFHDALPLLRRAVRLVPEEAAYRLLLGRVLALNPRWRKEAEEHLRRATDLAPWDGEAATALGLLYKATGLAARAKAMFEKALTINPDDPVARREVEAAARVSSSLGEVFRKIVARGE